MRFSLTGLLRLMVLLALGSSAVALGVARREPRETSFRFGMPGLWVGINGSFFALGDTKARFLNTETGDCVRARVPRGDQIEYPSVSAWQDESGEAVVAGRWTRWTGEGEQAEFQSLGIARHRFPSGELIDHVRLSLIPVGSPCWFPGSTRRVLFAAGDQKLYGFDFEKEDGEGPPPADGEDARPEPLRWLCAQPGEGGVVALGDPAWPADPKLGSRVFVSLSYMTRPADRPVYSGSQIWWLELDPEEMAIVAAGRLTPAGEPAVDERLPSLARTAEGNPVLAYLTKNRNGSSWALRVAPVSIDPATGVPSVHRVEGRPLADGCVTTAPAFSAHAQWVYALRARKHAPSALERFSVVEALAARSVAPAAPERPGRPAARPEGPPRNQALGAQPSSPQPLTARGLYREGGRVILQE